MKKKVALHNLGCKVNAYEVEAMQQLLENAGYETVPFEEGADVYVINTCTVTNIADRKSRQMLHKAKKMNPDAIVVATGCYAQADTEKLKEDTAVDLILGNNQKTQIVEALEEYEKEHAKQVQVIEINHTKEYEELSISSTAEHVRAYIKVQDGCNQFCSYCIIPYARGPVRSLPMDKAAEQVRALRAQGYREIVVTGIEISSYGHDLKDGTTLIDLLELIAREGGEMRIRLGSLEPRTVTREFCERAIKLPTLCPHFHLSMQSGCDATLRRMNRRYDTARYYESVELLREYFDDPAVTTDLITGFPEETEEEFGETLAFIEKCGFAAMHIFPYSIRPGTKAAAMAQVDMSVREERAARAAAVAERMHQGYLARCVGKTFPVLFEQDRGEGSVGHAPNYMPVTVGMKGLHNTVQNVRITAVDGDGLRGEPEET